MAKKVSVLFVCLGNICRSPTAHGIFRNLVKESGLDRVIEIDSAGTAAFHVGKRPDTRSIQVAKERGVEMMDLRARQVGLADLYQYDYVLAMDEANFFNLKEIALPEHYDKIQLFLNYTNDYSEKEVPDPYYGGSKGFEYVFKLIESASKGLLQHIQQKHLS